MAYLRPGGFQRKFFNKLAMTFGIGGSHTLVVRKRKSGEPQLVPVVPVEKDGGRYIVSTRGESEWVRNVRAAGAVELRGKSGTQRYGVEELPVEARAPVIELYRRVAGRTVAAYWRKLPDAADHPVFRLKAE